MNTIKPIKNVKYVSVVSVGNVSPLDFYLCTKIGTSGLVAFC